MKMIGHGHSKVAPKAIRDREPRTIGSGRPVPEARDERDKSSEKEKGESK